jgi:hypothetical protein
MMGHSASVLFALATMASAADTEVSSVSCRRLGAGQNFEIRTADRVYRGQLVDGVSGQCLLASSADGTHFGTPRKAFLLGATVGPQERQMLVEMNEVKVGLKMELAIDDLEPKNRQITSEVRAIRLGASQP